MFSILGRNVGRTLNHRSLSTPTNSVRHYSSYYASNVSNMNLNLYEKVMVGSVVSGSIIGTGIAIHEYQESKDIIGRIGYAIGGSIIGGVGGLFFGALSPLTIPATGAALLASVTIYPLEKPSKTVKTIKTIEPTEIKKD